MEINPNVRPEKERPQGVDIMTQLEQYSPEERKKLVSETAAIQLNSRCRGNCPFCMYGENTGGNSYYTYDSLTRFIDTYGPGYYEWPQFYHHSDEFDWRDGEHSFLDLYKKMREVQPEKKVVIYTAVNNGGEENFREFAKYAFREWINNPYEFKNKLELNLSIGIHNRVRIEKCMLRLTKELLDEGYDANKIGVFNERFVKRLAKDNHINPIGMLIKQQDKVRDLETPGAVDGVLITPDGIKAILMNIPTQDVISGVWEIELPAGKTKGLIPKRRDYFLLYRTGTNAYRPEILDGMLQMAIPINNEGAGFQLPKGEEVANLKIHLGRVVALSLRQIDHIAAMRFNKGVNQNRRDEYNSYLKKSAELYREQQEYATGLIREAKSFSDDTEKAEAGRERVANYTRLAEIYQKEMEYLANQIEEGKPFEMVATAATVLRQIGEKQAGKLEEILQRLDDFDAQIFDEEKTAKPGEDYARKTADRIVKYWGETFGIIGVNVDEYPEWVTELASLYSVRQRSRKRRESFSH